MTLKTMSKNDKINWADNVILELAMMFDLKNTKFLILAGKDYYEYLIDILPYYKLIPEISLPIGKRVQWFNNEIKKCQKKVKE